MASPDTSYQHILVFGTSLLDGVIVELLSRGMNLKVSKSSYTNEAAFLYEVIQKQPDVIVLSDYISFDLMNAFKFLFSMPRFAGVRIIVTSLGSNTVEVYMKPNHGITKTVYERSRITITTPADFMELAQK